MTANLKLYVFRGMDGGYTSGMLVCIAKSKEDAITYLCAKLWRDATKKQKDSEGVHIRPQHCGTWPWPRHGDGVKSKSDLVNLLRQSLVAERDVVEYPIEEGVCDYQGGGD